MENAGASVNIAHMYSRLLPTALAIIGIACVAAALAAARYSAAIAHYAV